MNITVSDILKTKEKMKDGDKFCGPCCGLGYFGFFDGGRSNNSGCPACGGTGIYNETLYKEYVKINKEAG